MMKSTCPGCGATFAIPDDMAGKEARCARCKTAFQIPASRPDARPAETPPVRPGPLPRRTAVATKQGVPLLVWGVCGGCALLIAAVAAMLFWPQEQPSAEEPPKKVAQGTPTGSLPEKGLPNRSVPTSPPGMGSRPKPKPKPEPAPGPASRPAPRTGVGKTVVARTDTPKRKPPPATVPSTRPAPRAPPAQAAKPTVARSAQKPEPATGQRVASQATQPSPQPIAAPATHPGRPLATSSGRPKTLEACIKDGRIFNVSAIAMLMGIAKTTEPQNFGGELALSPSGRLRVASRDMFTAFRMQLRFLILAEGVAGRSRVTPFFKEVEKYWVNSELSLKTPLLAKDATAERLRRILGPPSGSRKVPWMAASVDLYYDGTIGFAGRELWIDGPKFRKWVRGLKFDLPKNPTSRSSGTDQPTVQKPSDTKESPRSQPTSPKSVSTGPAKPKPPAMTQPTGKREERILALLGNAKSINRIYKAGMHSLDMADKVREYMNKNADKLLNRPLRDALRAYATNLDAVEENMALDVEVTKPQKLDSIRQTVGKEDSVSKPTKKDAHAWSRYGWLELGVADGEVRRVRMDCKPK